MGRNGERLRETLIRLAIRSTSLSLGGEGFGYLALSNNCRLLLRIYAANQPRGTPMKSAQGWRSQTKGESRKRTEESLLSSGRFRLSSATGWPGPLPVFIQLTFTSHAAFFGTFLGAKKVPYPPVPPYSLICQNFSKSVNPCNKCRGCIVYISRERGGASCTER